MDLQDGELRHRMKVSGDIHFGGPGFLAHFEGLEVVRAGELREPGGSFQLSLFGLLAELRKLTVVSDAYRDIIGLVHEETDDRKAKLVLVADAALIEDMARAVPEGATIIQEAFDTEAWLALVFSLNRYEPRSIGIVTSESVA